jgi:hypothetical protein
MSAMMPDYVIVGERESVNDEAESGSGQEKPAIHDVQTRYSRRCSKIRCALSRLRK